MVDNEENEDFQVVPDKIRSLSRIAQIVTSIGALVLLVYIVQSIYTANFDTTKYDEMWNFVRTTLVSEREFKDVVLKNADFLIKPQTYAVPMRISMMLLSLMLYVWGMFALYRSWILFRGYSNGEIFSALSAKRLSSVGWAVVLISPISKLSEYYQIKALLFSKTPMDFLAHYGMIDLNILVYVGVNDLDVYAIVFGLLIVMVGRILEEAARIAEENKSFI
jgi:hypothetical protein